MARRIGLYWFALLAGLACGSADETPTGPGPYIVTYSLELDSTLVADSLLSLNGSGQRVSATSFQHGWFVVFQMLSRDSMGGTAWLHATGPGSATLTATWTADNHTRSREATAIADSAGPLVLVLPDSTLP